METALVKDGDKKHRNVLERLTLRRVPALVAGTFWLGSLMMEIEGWEMRRIGVGDVAG